MPALFARGTLSQIISINPAFVSASNARGFSGGKMSTAQAGFVIGFVLGFLVGWVLLHYLFRKK